MCGVVVVERSGVECGGFVGIRVVVRRGVVRLYRDDLLF